MSDDDNSIHQTEQLQPDPQPASLVDWWSENSEESRDDSSPMAPCCHGYFPNLVDTHPMPRALGAAYVRPILESHSHAARVASVAKTNPIPGRYRPTLPEGLVEAVAAKFGTTVKYLLRNIGVKTDQLNPARAECYRQLLNLGWNYCQIGKRFNRDGSTIRDTFFRAIAKEAGTVSANP
jgi:hypothetical protein